MYVRMYVSLSVCVGIWVSDIPAQVQVPTSPTYLSYPSYPSIYLSVCPSFLYLAFSFLSISLLAYVLSINLPSFPSFPFSSSRFFSFFSFLSFPFFPSFHPFFRFHPFPPSSFVYPSILLSFCRSMFLSTLSICPFVYQSNYFMSHLKKSTTLAHFTDMSTLQFMIVSCHAPCSATEIQYGATQKHMHNTCSPGMACVRYIWNVGPTQAVARCCTSFYCPYKASQCSIVFEYIQAQQLHTDQAPSIASL